MNALSPEKFTWDKYISKANFSLHDLLDAQSLSAGAENFYYGKPKLLPGVTLVGYAQANRILVRNRPTGFVIMVEKDGEEVWFHVGQLPEDRDEYGNPLDGSSLPNCCYPDCGCASARVCMAKSGANSAARSLNPDV